MWRGAGACARQQDRIYRDMPKAAVKPKAPRKQHPYLVGCTDQEAALIARGAKKAGQGPTTFLRDLGLFQARRLLGLRQPGGE